MASSYEMTRLQRYISQELTHFVGKSCASDEARYELLKKILSTGRLEPRRSRLVPLGAESSVEISGTASASSNASGDLFSMGISGATRLSTNDVYEPDVVCFCDIPVEDLGIHMEKYSRFGLAFQKSFLVRQDANPVFYIAKDATDRFPSVHGRLLGKDSIEKGESLDAFFESYRGAYDRLFPWISLNGPGRSDVPVKLLEVLEEIMMLKSPLNDLFSHFKFFDSRETDVSNQNFYMEREWRIRGSLDFVHDNVHRAIFPSIYARRFREDFPALFCQVTFSD